MDELNFKHAVAWVSSGYKVVSRCVLGINERMYRNPCFVVQNGYYGVRDVEAKHE